MALAEASSVDRIEVAYEGQRSPSATRACSRPRCSTGVLAGHTEEDGQLRQRALAGRGARHRRGRAQGVRVARTSTSSCAWRSVSAATVEVAGTGFGPRNVPHLRRPGAELQHRDRPTHFAFFRYRDQPGMIGRVGTMFGEHGVNIDSAAVGRRAEGRGRAGRVMAVTTDAPVPDELVDEIAALDGFFDGRAVSL